MPGSAEDVGGELAGAGWVARANSTRSLFFNHSIVCVGVGFCLKESWLLVRRRTHGAVFASFSKARYAVWCSKDYCNRVELLFIFYLGVVCRRIP